MSTQCNKFPNTGVTEDSSSNQDNAAMGEGNEANNMETGGVPRNRKRDSSTQTLDEKKVLDLWGPKSLRRG